jgi:uncharacterized protein (TIGR03437 family)
MRLLSVVLAWPFVVNVAPAADDSIHVASDAPRISVDRVSGNSLNMVFLPINLSSNGNSITAVQFDIGFDQASLTFTSSVSSAVQWSGKGIWASAVRPSVERLLIVGSNQSTIPDGVVAMLAVQVRPDALPGLHPFVLSNAVASDMYGDGHAMLTIAGGVQVDSPATEAPGVLAVANAASYTRGDVSPGEIVIVGGTMLGPPLLYTPELDENGKLSTSLAGTRVFFDGIPAPIVYATREQVSVIVPYSVDTLRRTSLQVEYLGVLSPAFDVGVTRAVPGIFTLDQSGVGQGAIVNEDGTINNPANPAAAGSVVSIYATGEGQTSPPGVDGELVSALDLRHPHLPVRVSIGGHDADVLYAGSAAAQVSGLLQVNVRLPVSLLSGDSLPVVLSTLDSNSQSGVTIAVK